VIQLHGTLLIPKARIDLPQIEAPVQASPDVVVVDQPEAMPRLPRWRVLSEVVVTFGEDVRVTGYGFSGRLGGRIVVVEPASGGTIGRGELQVLEGKYEAYGQDLTIEEGRLLYGNAPINTPGIEFRAVRHLPDTKVGIIASGRLKQPEVRLYSDPPMDDTDVLAYLILGRAMETAGGEDAALLQRAAVSLGVGTELARDIASEVGVDVVNVEASAEHSEAALVLGKYLSPRLYVQYAVGFWESWNTWQVLYRLGNHWTLKAESGTVQSGVDVLYTIEK
jgi:translocation and assembly module TamB